MSVSTPVSCTNRLSMACEIRGKPGRIDRVGLKYGKELCVVDYVKAFGQVNQTEESDVLVVGGRKDVIRDGKKRGFGGVVGTETMLRGREKMVIGHV